MIMLFATDNMVLVSRISALFDSHGINFVVLGHHASLLGGGIMGINQRVMVAQNDQKKARQLIRENGLENDIDFTDSAKEDPQQTG